MWMNYTAIGLGGAVVLVALYLASCIRILNEYQRGVIFRLGRAMPAPKGPGLIMVFAPVDSPNAGQRRVILANEELTAQNTAQMKCAPIAFARKRRIMILVEDLRRIGSRTANEFVG